MSFISGLILVLSFVGLVVYSIKGHNLMIGFILMATLWTIVPIINQLATGSSASVAVDMLQAVYQRAPESWGGVLVNIFLGLGLAEYFWILRLLRRSSENPSSLEEIILHSFLFW